QHLPDLGAPTATPATVGAGRSPKGGWEGSGVIYRQRDTIVDDLLLRVIYPWFTALHATPLFKLAYFWTVPVQDVNAALRMPTRSTTAGVELPSEAASSEPLGRVA